MIPAWLPETASVSVIASCEGGGLEAVCATYDEGEPCSGESNSLTFGEDRRDSSAASSDWTRSCSGACGTSPAFRSRLDENFCNGEKHRA